MIMPMAALIPPENYLSRLSALTGLIDNESIDAVVVLDLLNVRYFCGFTGSSGLLIASRLGVRFFTDSRYVVQAGEETRGVEVLESRDLNQTILEETAAIDASRIGLQAKSLSAARWKKLESLLPAVDLIDLGTSIDEFREIKDASEIKLMREASLLAEESLCAVLSLVRPGVSEAEVALAFHLEILKKGADALSFDAIIAGGPRAALPHARPGSRRFVAGDLVVIDFGVKLNGYCSDQTVTVPVGMVDEEARKVYEVVLAAQTAALNLLKPGVRFSDIDAAARKVVADAGYGDFFRHGTGHGVGLVVHESPTVNGKSEEVARAGHVVTIEPGIYLPGKLGVRLEDLALVADDGFEKLTALPKEFGALLGVAV